MELKSWSGVWFAGWVVAASINSIFSDSLCKRAREKNLEREQRRERVEVGKSISCCAKENEASKGETKKTMGGAGVKLLEKVINTTNIFQEPIIQKCSTNRVSRSRNLETTCCTTNLFRVLIFFFEFFCSFLFLSRYYYPEVNSDWDLKVPMTYQWREKSHGNKKTEWKFSVKWKEQWTDLDTAIKTEKELKF